MNVIISNNQKTLLQSLEVDIIKSLDGEFEVDEIISTFQNFFYQRMILDITSIKDYKNIKNLQKLSIALDMDKLILVLQDDEESANPDYLSKIISMGIYNFTKNLDGIMYLYNNPNTYRDVAHIHQIEQNQGSTEYNTVYTQVNSVQIIGLKSLNEKAGATSLAYMMANALSQHYKVKGIEVDKKDFVYFRNKNLISTDSSNIGNIIAANSGNDVLLIDINNSPSAEVLCHEILFLLDPSTISLNKYLITKPRDLAERKDKKIMLNKSLLSSKDVLEFEYEAKTKIYYNLPHLDDREVDSFALNTFLARLGFTKMNSSEEQTKKNGFWSFLGL
ncbi:MAG: hypothetical protein R3Y21_02040 [Mycoplasmatota bacterium]